VAERWVPLDIADTDESPFVQFETWFEQAREHLREPEAVVLSTVNEARRPSSRYVLLRHHDGSTFGWFTNYDSKKARDLSTNDHASVLWYVEPLGRQVRIEGTVSAMSDEASNAYFASRPRDHQIGAWASHQSRQLASRAELEERVLFYTENFAGRDVPRPDFWGGFALTPDYFEFWQHRADRLHDRVGYLPNTDGSWRRFRLAP